MGKKNKKAKQFILHYYNMYLCGIIEISKTKQI